MASEYGSTTSFLQGVATNALSQASNNASRIFGLQNVTADMRNPIVRSQINKPNIGEPPKFSDLFGGDTTDPTMRYLDEQADAWMTKYFPASQGDFKSQPEETLAQILSGVRPFGLDKTILEMVWNQARDRVSRTVRSEQATLAAGFSARGFSLPPGAMVDLMAQVSQRGTDAVLDVSRDQAIKDADIKVEIFKLGLQLSTQVKTAIMSALADFYRMWITVPDKDIERARIKAQAQASLYSALASYYNVEISFEELRLKADQLAAAIDIDVDRNALVKQNNFMGIAGPLSSSVSAFANIAGNASQAGGSLTAQIESV
jgi:hypothetical protein